MTLAYEKVQSADFKRCYDSVPIEKSIPIIAFEAFRSGMTTKEIARIVGKSESTVKNWMATTRDSITLGKLIRTYMNLPNLDQMLKMLERGFSHAKIAQELSVDRSTIDNWIEGFRQMLLEVEQGGHNADSSR